MKEIVDINEWPMGCLEVRGIYGYSPKHTVLKTKKPYIINTYQVECVTGEWNKEKGEYGIRIYFVSGKDVWIGGQIARDFLDSSFTGDERKELVKKFDDRVKAGPPSV